MKQFAIRLTVFLAPLAIILALIIASAFYIGESIPISMIINWQAQSNATIVYQPWHRNTIYNYKFATIQHHQPSLMVLGTSRMAHFRSALANRDTSQFYNASIDGTSIGLSQALLDQLITQGTIPEVIIWGLDITNFSGETGYAWGNDYQFSPLTSMYDARHAYSGVRRVSLSWFENPIEMTNYLQTLRQDNVIFMGLAPMSYEHGFMWDGSRFFSEYEERGDEFSTHEWDIFEARRVPFNTGTSVNANSLSIVEQLLINAQENNIIVIGIMPPFKPSFIERMTTNSDFAYQIPATLALQNLFAEYEFPFYDISDPRTIGGSEEEMLDIWHFSDLMSLRIYNHLLEQSPDILGQFSDSDTLSAWLSQYQHSDIEDFMVDLP